MAGGRSPKPIQLVKGHRTKAEKEARKKAEEALLTGTSLKEWPEVKANKAAHKEFKRLRKLLKAIDKDDGLHESIINRYCLLHAECKQLEEMKERCNEELEEIFNAYHRGELDLIVYLDTKERIHGRYIKYDKKIMDKRKMMLDIEKENIMTIASALRSIPKKPQKQEDSPMAAFLKQRQANINGAQ